MFQLGVWAWIALISACFGLTLIDAAVPNNVRKNMILFYADDLRTDLNTAYGRLGSVTPELDRFTSSSGTVVIGRAYANYPMCSPSRISMLFGKLPTNTGVMTNLDEDDEEASEFASPSLPKFLQSRGYFTATGGKVFHQPGINGDDCWNLTYAPTLAQRVSWCRQDRRAQLIKMPGTNTRVSPQLCLTTSPVNSLPDMRVAIGAKKTLDYIVTNGLFPFFMSVGFYKPHVPLQIHRRFWQMVRTTPEAERSTAPGPRASFPYPQLSFIDDANNIYAVKQSAVDLTIFGRPAPNNFRSTLRRAYAVGVTQTDYAFGIVYRALESHNLLNETLVIFVSDHGYQLGENNMWAKNVLFETALRVPMIISAPWLVRTRPTGVLRLTSTFFELVDVYKTSLGLLSLDAPADVDGMNLSSVVRQTITNGVDPMLRRPARGNALSIVARCGNFDSCVRGQVDVTAVGFTYRDVAYRYVVWMRSLPNRTVDWNNPGNFIADELYDHANDETTVYNYERLSYDTEYFNLAPLLPEIRQRYWNMTRLAFSTA